jgi:HAD superfamily hydrolase (TIGR01490 family)
MEADRTAAAIFDLDGTLFSGHVWHAVVQHHQDRHINRRWLYAYLAAHMPYWYLYKLGLISGEQMRYAWSRDMSWTLRGIDQRDAEVMFAWITDEYIMPLLRQEVVEILRDHQGEGHRVILLSGSFEGLLVVVGRRLGVSEIVGTRLEQLNGRFVGRAVPPICQGRGKLERLQAYVSDPDRAVEWAASYAYADSVTDVPVLEAVGHPVAVYPDDELAALADERGWPIIGVTM